MTDETGSEKKVNYFSWQFVKSPKGMLIIMIILIVSFVVLWIFVKPAKDRSQDALINQKDAEIKELKSELKDERDFRKGMEGRMESLEAKIEKGNTNKTQIYERIKIETRYLDSMLVPDQQKWFDTRFPPSKSGPGKESSQ